MVMFERLTLRWRLLAVVALALLAGFAVLQPREVVGQSGQGYVTIDYAGLPTPGEICISVIADGNNVTSGCIPWLSTGSPASEYLELTVTSVPSGYLPAPGATCTSNNYDTPPTFTYDPGLPSVLRVEPRAGETVSCTYQYIQRPIVIEKGFAGRIPTNDDLPTLSGLPQGATLDSSEWLTQTRYRWTYYVPWDAEGFTISESPVFPWFAVGSSQCAIEGDEVDNPGLVLAQELAEPDCEFTNQVARDFFLIHKHFQDFGDRTLSEADLPALSGLSANAQPLYSGWYDSDTYEWAYEVDADWDGTITETPATHWLPIGPTTCARSVQVFGQVLLANGVTPNCEFTNRLRGPGGVIVEKWEDVNRNGVFDGEDVRVPGWDFRIQGEGVDATATTDGNGRITAYGESFPTGSTVTISDLERIGWSFVASDVDGAGASNDDSREVEVLGETQKVARFLNQRNQVAITARKTVFEPNSFGEKGGEGWTFTLTGCGIEPDTQTTDDSGEVTWSDLPAAIDCQYSVAESLVEGWVAENDTLFASPYRANESVTLEFRNTRHEVCADCDPPTPTPTATPSPTPTATPTTPPVDPPTSTPTALPPTTTPTATATPTPDGDSAVGSGNLTPTPIAPATGGGTSSSASAPAFTLLFAALAAMAGGAALLAMRRR